MTSLVLAKSSATGRSGFLLYLRRLEMTGFKSFPDHVRLDFLKGITAIVGPNGSGKSNISDAIRWVLGEHNPRVLRGSRMEDVIFNGSDCRRALGAAEVTLVLDNSDRRAPIDCDEIVISRRMYRSGESEYLLNNAVCRLKDVRDLFLDTGLGRNSYAIVEQGRVDAILSASSDERRAFFDETAGVAKCKARKQEALAKLDDVERNIVRVWDLINELSVRVETLRGQADQARKYLRLRDRLADLETGLLGNRYIAGKNRLEAISLEITELRSKYAAASDRVSATEVELSQTRSAISAIDAKLESINAQLTEIVASVERCEGRQAVARERIRLLGQEKARLAKERQECESQLGQLQAHLAQEQQKLANLIAKVSVVAAELRASENELAEFLTGAAALEQAIENLKGEIVGVASELADCRNALSDSRARLETGMRNLTKLDERLEQIRAARKDALAEADSIQRQLEQALSGRQGVRRRLEQLETMKSAADKELAELARAVDVKRRNLGREESRLLALKELDKAHEGFFEGVRAVLEGFGGRPGMLGVVADLIRVAPKYVPAIEAALGSALQDIVVETDAIARECIQFLKDKNRGRATFLPLDLLRVPPTAHLQESVRSCPGVVGLASSLVEVSKEGARLAVDHLLGRTVIAVDLDAAVALARKLNGSARIVTLDGDIISQGGSITGGSRESRDRGILTRRAQIEQLTGRVDQMRRELIDLERLLEESEKRRTGIEVDIDSLGAELKNADLLIAELTGKLQSLKKDIDRLELEEKLTLDERAELEQSLNRYRQQVSELTRRLEELQESEKRLEEELGQKQASLRVGQSSRDTINERITNLRVDLGKNEEAVRAQRATIQRLDGEIAAVRLRLSELASRGLQSQKAMEDAHAEIQAAVRDREQLESRKASLEEELKRLKQERLDASSRIAEHELAVREARRELNGLAKEISSREVEIARVSENLSAIASRLREEYMMEPELLQIRDLGMDEASALSAIESLKQSIRELGPVNTAAVEEFEEAEERYRFLCSQRDDLVNAKKTLNDVIAEIDEEMKRRFKQTFEIVNEYFREMFVRLFDGGRAQLVLDNPDDLLSTGIEIYAEPPGKRLQSLSLLSGGERALTAIALVFAMMKANPSPFAVLDEIDAALDEANVSKFSKVLRELSQTTQFLVVTHRRGTMEAADALYGVIMEESGVSKVVSVKLED